MYKGGLLIYSIGQDKGVIFLRVNRPLGCEGSPSGSCKVFSSGQQVTYARGQRVNSIRSAQITCRARSWSMLGLLNKHDARSCGCRCGCVLSSSRWHLLLIMTHPHRTPAMERRHLRLCFTRSLHSSSRSFADRCTPSPQPGTGKGPFSAQSASAVYVTVVVVFT